MPRPREGANFYRSLALLSITVAMLAGVADVALWRTAQRRARADAAHAAAVERAQVATRQRALAIQKAELRHRRCGERNLIPVVVAGGPAALPPAEADLVRVELVPVEEVNP